jgi:polar amino acid transport system substrate-binding protein
MVYTPTHGDAVPGDEWLQAERSQGPASRSISLATVQLVKEPAVVARRPDSEADLDDIRDRGWLTVATIPFDRVPDTYRVNSFDLEIVATFAEAQRLEVQTVLLPTYRDLIPALLTGRGDVAAGALTVTEDRRKLVEFTRETFPSRMVLVTRKPQSPIRRLEDVAGHKFGTERGTSPDAATRAIAKPSQIDDSFRIEDLATALRDGRITAAVYELHVVSPIRQREPELQLGMKLGSAGSLALAVRKNSPALLAGLNEHIHDMRCDGRWVKLSLKHFGTATPELIRESAD